MKFFLKIILFYSFYGVFAQNISNEKSQLWLGYITNTKISEHYSWWNDAHLVPKNFGIIRTGLTYNFNNIFKNNLTTGIAFAIFAPLENQTVYGKEWRPWMQSTMSFKDTYFDYLLRLRYEARFRAKIIDNTLQNEFNFNHRIRLMLQTRHYFGESKNYFWMLADEILINSGHSVNNSVRLDQNRISAGLGYKFKQTTVQLDYMNQMILSQKTNEYSMNHNLQILVFQNFSF